MATRDIIVIGASAGGVQALLTLVADLPPNLPAAVITAMDTTDGVQIKNVWRPCSENTLKTATRESQTLNTGPILAGVDGDNPDSVRFIHTVVPISDASGSIVTRLFLYSEKVD